VDADAGPGYGPVGFDYKWSTGYLFQTNAVFDLEALRDYQYDEIREAWLSFKEVVQARHSTYTAGDSCVSAVEAVRSGAREHNLYDFYEGAWIGVQSEGSIDEPVSVLWAVERWLAGEWPNQGLVLRGHDESFDIDNDEYDLRSCMSRVSDFELRLVLANKVLTKDVLVDANLDTGGFQSPNPASAIGSGLTERVSGPTPTPTPRPTLPELSVTSIQARGKKVNSGSDCDPGDNTVLATIKNGGGQRAGQFSVRLQVDGKDEGSERVPGLDSDKDTVVEFEKVDLDKGERTLRVIADADQQVTEAAEGNNVRELKVMCQDEG
jgi:hypothetical protein